MSAAVLFSACGGGSDASDDATPTPAATATAAPASASGGTPTAAATPGSYDFDYVVQDGDTLGVIAEQFSVSIESVLEANGLTEDSSLSIGQVLHIIGSPSTPGVNANVPDLPNPVGIQMAMPIEGACITSDDGQMPNSPREYRNGIHEGVDFFTGFACVDVPDGMPVLAAAAGTIIRADETYKAITQEQIDALEEQAAEQGYTDPGTLDKFRGRQVWIDHGNGIVTRYCHLSGIADGVTPGVRVEQGQVIAYVGDSGTPESVGLPQYNKHLHWEVRVDDSFLGEGKPPEEVRALYLALFKAP